MEFPQVMTRERARQLGEQLTPVDLAIAFIEASAAGRVLEPGPVGTVVLALVKDPLTKLADRPDEPKRRKGR